MTLPNDLRSTVPAARLRAANEVPLRPDGRAVIYWMVAQRRLGHNFALERAAELAHATGRPLLIFEALRCGYRWASARLHRFVLDGMAEHRRALAGGPVGHLAYVEPEPGAGRGLLEALAADAVAVVTDELPCFFLPRMVAAAAGRIPARLEVVDGTGLLPLVESGAFPSAYAFRRHLQRTLRPHLRAFPAPDPLALYPLPPHPGVAPAILARWPEASEALLGGDGAALRALPIDQGVAPVPGAHGGSGEGGRRLECFLEARLARYDTDRNEPSQEGASGLSPWLHFGHVGAHQLARAVLERQGWREDHLGSAARGHREGWWGLPPAVEGFLDELVTWRELGYGFCAAEPGFDRFETLPGWARATLDAHAGDPRPHRYDLEELAAAQTHDPLWNAAQRQLLTEGRIHNYLRMLWGKKVLEWAPTPGLAWEWLIELNNRFALDGRDPNSYTGIAWTFGRFDRPWGPARPIFGTVRYMSSESTARKYDVKPYLARYGAAPARGQGSLF